MVLPACSGGSTVCRVRPNSPERRRTGLIRPIVYLVILPFLVYLLVFLPWFLRGHTLWEWILMQSDAFREMRHLGSSGFHPFVMELRGPVRWFTHILAVGFNPVNSDGWGVYISIMNNIPVWIFILPAIGFCSMQE